MITLSSNNTNEFKNRLLILSIFTICLFYSGFLKAKINPKLFAPTIYTTNESESLKSKTILKITQDDSGFIWVGTHRGLFRYDGYQYKLITSQNDNFDISKIYVRSLLSRGNNLWIGTMIDGLFHINLTTYEITAYLPNKDEKNSIISSQINGLAFDNEENLWIATSEGLDKYDLKSNNFSHYQSNEVITSQYKNYLIDIEFDHNNQLWISTAIGLAKLDKNLNSYTRFYNGEKNKTGINLNNKVILDIYLSKDNRLWLSTDKSGTYIFDPINHAITSLAMETPNKGKVNTAILQPNDAEIWISGASGIEVRSAGSGQLIRTIVSSGKQRYGLMNDIVYAMHRSHSGLVLLGVANTGIQYHNSKNEAFKRFNFQLPQLKPLLNQSILKTSSTSNNELIVLGTKQLSLLNLDSLELSPLLNQKQFKNVIANDVLKITDDIFWFALSNNSFVRYNHKNKQIENFSTPMSNREHSAVLRLVKGAGSNIWVVTDNRLFRYDIDTQEFETIMNSDGKPFIRHIQNLFFDSQQRLWLALLDAGGLINKNDSSVQLFSRDINTNKTLSDNDVLQITENDNREILVRTRSGIDKFIEFKNEKLRFKKFALQATSKIKQSDHLLVNPDLTLWHGSRFLFDDKGNVKYQFSAEDGANEPTGNSSMLHFQDNKIIYNSAKSLLLIEQSKLDSWKYSPPIITTELSIGERKFPYGLGLTDSIEIKSNEDKFQLRFSALDFSSPNNNQYRYKLKGFDDWNSTPSDIRLVKYNSLSPGDYELLLNGTNRNGEWSKQQLSIKIIVEPKYYQTWWFRAVFSLICLLFLIILFRWRMKIVLNKERQIYEKREAVNHAKMVDELLIKKNQLLADVSHELGTPLTVLKLQVEALKDDIEDDVQATYDSLDNKLSDIGHLIGDIHQLAQSDIGVLQFNFQEFNISDSFAYWRQELEDVIDKEKLSFVITNNLPEQLLVKFDRDKIKQVLTNLLTNSVKYTNKPGSVRLHAEMINDKLNLSIEDSAPGVSEQDLTNIFERLYRVEGSRSRDTGGSGLGLAICKSLIEAHQGKIFAEHSKLGGVKIIIEIPINH